MQAGQVDATEQLSSPSSSGSIPRVEREVAATPGMRLPEAALWCGLAFAANAYLAIPVFNSQALYLGQGVSLLVLLLTGWRAAVLVSVGAAAGMWWAGQGVAASALCLVETVIVGALFHRRLPIVPGMLLFWLLLGAPAAYVVPSISDSFAVGCYPSPCFSGVPAGS